MKKSLHILLCAALLALAACIPVSDFGAYWDKGTADTALAGTWDEIIPAAKATEEDKKPSGVAITCDDKACTLETLDPEEKKKADYAPMAVRTLAAGSYKYLLVRDEGKTTGDIVRYTIADGVFSQHALVPAKAEALLKEKYPAATNISRGECKDNKCLFDGISIKLLDDEVFKFLSEIPDTADYWTAEQRYRKRG